MRANRGEITGWITIVGLLQLSAPISWGETQKLAWEPILAYTKLGECQQEVERRLSKLLEKKGAELVFEGTVMIKGTGAFTYRCLPDTVDPR